MPSGEDKMTHFSNSRHVEDESESQGSLVPISVAPQMLEQAKKKKQKNEGAGGLVEEIRKCGIQRLGGARVGSCRAPRV
ncbi:hypothetical protein CEXT_594231 [Caerostris extrusa]|uniref:Uncharacterized protein n=1 Tax=Caerostris extrusa TaxID=172846 RepID=A0AAV4T209_CAEEX|nr:hypothetical protein CEXT_594231 [Caerostris extrusa]